MIPVTKETGACANFVLDSQDWYCMGNEGLEILARENY